MKNLPITKGLKDYLLIVTLECEVFILGFRGCIILIYLEQNSKFIMSFYICLNKARLPLNPNFETLIHLFYKLMTKWTEFVNGWLNYPLNKHFLGAKLL